MAVLKKIKASTLMETLIATVLVVVTFLLASMILNNLVSNAIQSDTQGHRHPFIRITLFAATQAIDSAI